MQRHNNYSTTIALIVAAHQEGLLLVPALRSALAAVEACQAAGVDCRIAVLGCDLDAATRQVVARYQAASSLVSCTELGAGAAFHPHALTQVNAEFYCFLNGDDIVQPEWPLMAYRHAQAGNYLNCIFHTELLAGIGGAGSAPFVHAQLKSNDPIFHPLHALVAQHFFHNMFCHAAVLERAPDLVRHGAAPHGFDTWHWGCETLALGIGRDYVPGTVQFVRGGAQAETHQSRCDALARPAALLKDAMATASYAAFSGLHDGSEAAQLALRDGARYRDAFPAWLVREAKRAAGFDSEVYELLKAADTLACDTPPVAGGAAWLLARAARFCAEPHTVIALDCDSLAPEQAATLELGIRQARQKGRVLVLCGDLLTGARLAREEAGVCYLNLRMAARSCHGAAPLYGALAALLASCPPRAILNLNLDLADEACGLLRCFLERAGIPAVRYLLGALEDVHSGYSERRVLAALNQGRYAYSHLAVTNFENFQYARTLFGPGGTDVLVVPARLSHVGALVEHMVRQGRPQAAAQPVARTTPATGPVDVSCILNLHREGNILIPTFRSIARMLHFAQQQGVACELVIVLDKADRHSRRLAIEAQAGVLAGFPSRVCEVENGDLGRSRRDGVAQACGDYVAFLDGDDLYSENWIADAYLAAQSEGSGTPTIYHPELNVYFGEHYRTFWHPDAQALAPEARSCLLLENFWTSLSFGPRALYLANPVDDNGLELGFGYEDWQWNQHTTAQGIAHRPVPRTLHFIRLKPAGSLNSNSSRRSVIVRPSQLAHSLVFADQAPVRVAA